MGYPLTIGAPTYVFPWGSPYAGQRIRPSVTFNMQIGGYIVAVVKEDVAEGLMAVGNGPIIDQSVIPLDDPNAPYQWAKANAAVFDTIAAQAFPQGAPPAGWATGAPASLATATINVASTYSALASAVTYSWPLTKEAYRAYVTVRDNLLRVATADEVAWIATNIHHYTGVQTLEAFLDWLHQQDMPFV
jgi:hypothetical protein